MKPKSLAQIEPNYPYVNTLLEDGRLTILRKRKCTVTGYPFVNEYTGNPDLFPQSNQLRMF